MKNRRLAILVGSICLVSILVVLPLMAACAAPAPSPAPGPAPAPAPAPQKVFKWRAQSMSDPPQLERQRFEFVADLIRERSGGRLDITWYSAGEVIPTGEIFDAVKTGVIEMGFDMAGYHGGFMPEAKPLFMLPASFKNSHDIHHFGYSQEWMFSEKVREAYLERGVQLVDVYSPTSQYLLMLTRPIERLDDLAGFKIRSYGSLSEWLGKTGAGMVFFPTGEIYTGLATGTVDAATFVGYAMNYAMKLHEPAKYIWEVPGAIAFWSALTYANIDAWNELPDDLKLMLEYYHRFWATKWIGHFDLLGDEMCKEKMIEEWGATIIELPQEDNDRWLTMGRGLWDEMAAESPRSAEWVDYIKEWMKWRGYLD